MVKPHGKWALALALLVLPTLVWGTNGMYLGGYGSEAAGRAGANIAVADRALGLQANPAGIAQLQGNHYSVDIQILMPDLSYSGDPFGNSIEGDDRSFYMPSFSYVRGGAETPWTWGIGVVSQGGMGATYEGYSTPFGTTDQTYSQVRFGTVTPTVAYNATPNLSFGLSANLGWSDVEFRFWPETSFYTDSGTPLDPSDDVGFFGPNLIEQATAFNYSFRSGVMWSVNPKWQVGAIYQTKTQGDYEDGKLSLDMSSLGLGNVKYDAEVDGFTWPEQYGVGVQFRPAERWILALDVKRHMWSDAIERITVEGKNPDNAFSPFPVVQLPFTFLWDDQTVTALGAEFRLNDDVTLRAGFNHGDSPVPDETLNPLFPATPEDHATVGVGWTRGQNVFNFAVERAFEATQTNNNPDQQVNPFGPGVTIDHSQWTISFGYSRAFSRR